MTLPPRVRFLVASARTTITSTAWVALACALATVDRPVGAGLERQFRDRHATAGTLQP